MATEIERKFLVRGELWRRDAAPGVRYRQGYLSIDPARAVRVRLAGADAFLTIKGPPAGIARTEFEYPVPPADAEFMLERLCISPLIEKWRFRVPFGGRIWEVDEFEGENEGLLLAEVELPAADARVAVPPWAGREVSDDPRYFNVNLVSHPYHAWARPG